MKRILGFIRFALVLVLAGLVLQYAPQSSSKEDVQVIPPENITFKAVPSSEFIDANDIAAAGLLLPMENRVRCFKRSTERPMYFSAHSKYSISPTPFKASSSILYWYCHNLAGRDWVRPYQMTVTILYPQHECSPADRPLRGFKITNHFRDHYRHISYNKGMWEHCHNRGFSSRTKWLPKRSTGRLFNREHLPPDSICYIKADYVHDGDGHGKKRLPMLMHSTDGGRPTGVPL